MASLEFLLCVAAFLAAVALFAGAFSSVRIDLNATSASVQADMLDSHCALAYFNTGTLTAKFRDVEITRSAIIDFSTVKMPGGRSGNCRLSDGSNANVISINGVRRWFP